MLVVSLGWEGSLEELRALLNMPRPLLVVLGKSCELSPINTRVGGEEGRL